VTKVIFLIILIATAVPVPYGNSSPAHQVQFPIKPHSIHIDPVGAVTTTALVGI
jgi:hypothetical protein